MSGKAYVILNPHSRGNWTDHYRIVLYADWTDLIRGRRKLIFPAAEFSHYHDARSRCIELNNPSKV